MRSEEGGGRREVRGLAILQVREQKKITQISAISVSKKVEWGCWKFSKPFSVLLLSDQHQLSVDFLGTKSEWQLKKILTCWEKI